MRLFQGLVMPRVSHSVGLVAKGSGEKLEKKGTIWGNSRKEAVSDILVSV